MLAKIKSANTSTFEIPQIESFINSFKCQSLKAGSHIKSDIRVVIHDVRTTTEHELGFSIKSQLGGASTLLNAGKTTNFIFSISNLKLSAQEIDEINTIETRSKIKDRIAAIVEKGGLFNFIKTESEVFGDNLTLIDSALPQILAEIIYKFFSSSLSTVSELVKDCTLTNPLKYNVKSGQPFYQYKIKRLLTDIALGMMPSIVWTGQLDATGGYLVVKDDGEILCYHIYDRNQFEDYLFENTKLETASSNRHDFGKLLEINGDFYFKLNLQIRFK